MAAKVLISFKNIRKNLANMNEPGPENSTMSAINIKWKTKTIAEDVEQLLLNNIIEFMKANSIEWVRKLTSTCIMRDQSQTTGTFQKDILNGANLEVVTSVKVYSSWSA